MSSTFHGLETARRGMMTQQGALYVTGHNIANANTPGFSRQRVNFVQTEPYPPASMNRPQMPGQMGTGVAAGTIQRVREGFLDNQYRNENNKLGYWTSRSQALQRMEDIINEPSKEGLANALDEFWTSLEDLSVHPEDSGARSVVRQRGTTVAETFNYLRSQMETIKKDLGVQTGQAADEINSLLTQIDDINKQIGSIEPHGYLPNDLYDERDRLVDELSQFVNIKVIKENSGGNSLDIAEGKYTIQLLGEDNAPLQYEDGTPITLVDGVNHGIKAINVKFNETGEYVEQVSVGSDAAINISNFTSNGKLLGLIKSFGFVNDASASPLKVEGLYPEMIQNLDKMAFQFVQEFNRVHTAGWSVTEINSGEKVLDNYFFNPITSEKGAASNIKLHTNITNSLDNIAASASHNGLMVQGKFNFSAEDSKYKNATSIKVLYDGSSYTYELIDKNNKSLGVLSDLTSAMENVTVDVSKVSPKAGDTWNIKIPSNGELKAFVGDGSNALALANVKDTKLPLGVTETGIQSFYQSIIGDMGVKANQANKMMASSETLLSTVQYNKDSVSSVSLDEEMTNMIKFQHAYNASARQITLMDEILDKIINGMGLVGR